MVLVQLGDSLEAVMTKLPDLDFLYKLHCAVVEHTHTSLCNGPGHPPLQAAEAAHVIQQTAALLCVEPTLLQVNPGGKSVIVFGDTHGQVHDLFHALRLCGAYSGQKVLLFNGDYVDRGSWGLEVLILVTTLKLAMPNEVFMLRGNHEGTTCTKYYGFREELRYKFKDLPSGSCKSAGRKAANVVYTACIELFKHLPLAARVGSGTLVCHGGLWRKPPSERRKKGQKRRKVLPLASQGGPAEAAEGSGAPGAALSSCSNRSDPVCDGEHARGRDEPAALMQLGTLADLRAACKGGAEPSDDRIKRNRLAADVLWSDPVPSGDLACNEARGLGLVFGPDVTRDFLRNEGLRLIVRSHEGPDARFGRSDVPSLTSGHSVDHETPDGRLVTVFSAPDYPQHASEVQRCKNKGAVLELEAPDYSCYKVLSYEAVERPAMRCFYDVEIPGSDIALPGSEGDLDDDASTAA